MLFNSINDAAFVMEYSENGIPKSFIDVNEAGLKKLGYDRNEFLMLSPFNIVPETDYAKMKNYFAELFNKGSLIYEISHVTKTGKLIQVEAADNIFTLEKGRKIGICVARDISKRKELEEKLLDYSLKYRNLIEFLPIGVYQVTTDENGHFIDVNDYMVKTFGAESKEELKNVKITDLYTEYAGEETRRSIIRKVTEKGSYEFETKRKTLKGRVMDVYITCRLKKDDEGHDILDCVLKDITDEKEKNKKLKENEILFKTLVNGLSEGIYINDAKIIYANPSAIDIFGYPAEELYNKFVWDLFDEKDRAVIEANIKRRLNGEEFYFEHVFNIINGNGEEKSLLFHVQTAVYKGRFVALASFKENKDKTLCNAARMEETG
jgi:PAS domain S-box-containing protein